MEWHPVSERIIVARFKSRPLNVTIIQCYAPTNEANLDIKESFYDQLTQTILQRHKKDICLLLGDFNAQIGSDNSNLEHIMGIHALGNMSENGELFSEFCNINDFVIGGSVFPHKYSHKITWCSPNNRDETQIDHICVSRRHRRCLLDVRNKRSADIGSDHHLIVGEFEIRTARAFKPQEKRGKRFNTLKLRDQETRSNFAAGLETCLPVLDCEDINNQWSSIKSAFLQASNDILGPVICDRKEWMTDETWRAIDDRRTAKQAINISRTRAAKKQATDIWLLKDKEVGRLCRRDRSQWVNDLAAEAEDAAKTGNLRVLYETTKKLSGRHNTTAKPVKDKNGRLLTAPMDQMKRWHEHFNELLNIQADSTVSDAFSPARVPRVQRINSAAPTVREIEEAIASMKSNKSPGIDQITSEMLKANPKISAQLLHPIFKKIWEDEVFPDDWLQGILVKVPKKGDLSDCDNWRGIMLLCCPVKVFCRVLLNRFEKKVDETLRNAQAGFRSGRSCVDQINTLRIIIEQVNEYQNNLHLVFVDFSKAFDTLIHRNIWEALERKGIPAKLINLIKAQYINFKCRILHNGNLSDPILCQSGVRQGCILSPLLFLIVLDEVLATTMDGKKTGIQWSLRSNDHLEDLDFADDIALLSQKRSSMQAKLTSLSENAKKVGLNINISKTKSMYVGDQAPATFDLAGTAVERVDSFAYLGSQITPDGGSREDVKVRIRKAQCAFGQLGNIWRSNQLSLLTKIRVFNSNVKSVLLYGCETWLVADDVTRSLQVFVNRCLRRILKIFWPKKIRNTVLLRKCKQEPIDIEIRRRKWGWLGHTLRRDADSISRQALDWNPQGQRRVGAPRRTWRRSLDMEIRKINPTYSWRSIKPRAADRNGWRGIISTLCDT